MKLKLDKLLDAFTAYMIVGIGTCSLFAELAQNQKVFFLFQIFNAIYSVSILFIAAILLYYIFIKSVNLVETFFIAIFITIISCLFLMLHGEYTELWKYIIWRRFIKHGLILYLLLRLKPNYKNVVHYCNIIARVTVIVFSLILFTTDWFKDDYLTVSDNLSIAVMIVLGTAIYYGNLIDYCIGAFGIIAMILWGDRAHIVCVLAAFLLWGCKKIPDNKYAKRFRIAFVTGILFLIAIFLYNADTILTGLTLFLSNLGVDSRNITYLLGSRIADSSGRDYFYQNIWEHAKTNPFGYGLLGDFILNYENGITSKLTGAYAHNIYLELVCETGLLVGTVLSILLIVQIIKTYVSIKNNDEIILFIAMCCSGTVILLFSYSYWTSTIFWGVIAMIINNKKIEKLNNE